MNFSSTPQVLLQGNPFAVTGSSDPQCVVRVGADIFHRPPRGISRSSSPTTKQSRFPNYSATTDEVDVFIGSKVYNNVRLCPKERKAGCRQRWQTRLG